MAQAELACLPQSLEQQPPGLAEVEVEVVAAGQEVAMEEPAAAVMAVVRCSQAQTDKTDQRTQAAAAAASTGPLEHLQDLAGPAL